MRIGVTGAGGMLGTALIDLLSKNHEIFATSRTVGQIGSNIHWDCYNLTNIELLDKWLENVKPQIVIHCAAIVNVDNCEKDVYLATLLHEKTTEILAMYSELNKVRIIYISTDSVFDGTKKGLYNELDNVNPINVYAKTKLLGERFVQSSEFGLILRVNIIGWTRIGKSSFAEWILTSLMDNLKLKLFSDVFFSPITVYDLSLIIEMIIDNPIYGLYHCAGRDSVSKYDFGLKMADIFEFANFNIKKTSIDNFDLKANRPKNMAMDVSKISKELDIVLPSFEDSIRLMKSQYDNNINIFNQK
jgi:dTDP-4-dehydrorhamnose reductase